MMTPKIAILGCGWLGLPLAKSFLKKGFSVVGSTTSIDKLKSLNEIGIQALVWSLSDNHSDDSIRFLVDIDVLILNIPPRKTGDSIQYSTSLANFCSKIPSKITVLFISTTSVYPDDLKFATEEYKWTENDLLKETVQAEDKLSRVLNSRLTILRLAGLIGEDRHPINTLSARKDVPNGKSPVNLIHLNDVIGLIQRIIEVECWGKVFNGCFPLNPSREEYYEKMAAFFNLEKPYFASSVKSGKIISSVKSEVFLNYKYLNSIYLV